MKKIRIKLIIFTALVGTMSGFYAQAVGTPYIPEVQIPFSFLSGGTGDDVSQAVEPTSDGGYIVAGVSASSATGDVTGTNHGGQDFWVVKYDSLGKIQWQKLYGGSGDDVAYCIKQTSDGGYLVGGSAGQNNGDVSSLQGGLIWVIKLSSTGTISWQKGFGTGTRLVRSIVETSDGFVMTGVANGQNGRLFWAGKLSLDGNTVLWSNTYADGNNDAVFYGMAKADDESGFILCGYTKNDGTSLLPNVLVMKINPTGGLVWKKVYGGDKNDAAYAVAAAPNGGSTIVSGSSSSASGNVTGTNHGSVDFWILNLDAAGNLISQQLYGGSHVDTPFSIQQTSDGGFMVAGASSSSASGDVTGTNHGGSDVWLLKLSSTGAIQWQRLYGGSGSDGSFPLVNNSIAVDARQTSDGGYIVTATSRSSQSGDVTDKTNNPASSTTNINDYWLFKTDASGNIVTVPNVGQR